jgi:Flp pilus assembly protein TadG
LRSEDTGANLVEAVLVLFLLIVLVAGLADIGRAWHSLVVVHNASREGARYASRFPDSESEIRQAAIAEAAGSTVALYETNVFIVGLNATAGQPISVKVAYPYRTIMGSVIGVGSVITLTGVTEMIVFGIDD